MICVIFNYCFVLGFSMTNGQNRAWQTSFLKTADSHLAETGFKTLLPKMPFLENKLPNFDQTNSIIIIQILSTLFDGIRSRRPLRGRSTT